MSSRYFTIRLFKKRPKKGHRPPKVPKAFKTEAKAKEWADSMGMKDYKIEAIQKSKFKIRQF